MPPIEAFCQGGECVVPGASEVSCDAQILEHVFPSREFLPKCSMTTCAPGNPRADNRTGCVHVPQHDSCDDHHASDYYAWIDALPNAKCLDKVCAPAVYEEGLGDSQGSWIEDTESVDPIDPFGCTATPRPFGCECGEDPTNRCDIMRCTEDPEAKFGASCQVAPEGPCRDDFACNPLVKCIPADTSTTDALIMAGMNNFAPECEYTKGGAVSLSDSQAGNVPSGTDACRNEITDECKVVACTDELTNEQIGMIMMWGAQSTPSDCGCYFFDVTDIKAGTQCQEVPWLFELHPQLAMPGGPCEGVCTEQANGTYTCSPAPPPSPGFAYPLGADFVVSPYECQAPMCVSFDGQPGFLVESEVAGYCASLFSGECADCVCDPAAYLTNGANPNRLPNPTTSEVVNSTVWLQFTQTGCDCSGNNDVKCNGGNLNECNGAKQCAFTNGGVLRGLARNSGGLDSPLIHSLTGCMVTADPVNCFTSISGNDGTVPMVYQETGHTDVANGRQHKHFVDGEGENGRCTCGDKEGDALDICQNEHFGNGTFFGDSWQGQGTHHPDHVGFSRCMAPHTEPEYAGSQLFLNEDMACDHRDQSCNYALLQSCYRNSIPESTECDMCDTRICTTLETAMTKYSKFPADNDIATIFDASQVPSGQNNPDLSAIDSEQYTCVNLDLGASTCPPNELSYLPERAALTSSLRSAFRGIGRADENAVEHANRAGFKQIRDVGCVKRECDPVTNVETDKLLLPRTADHTCCDTGAACVQSTCDFDETDPNDLGTCNQAYLHSVCNSPTDPCLPKRACVAFTHDQDPNVVDPIRNPNADEDGCVEAIDPCLGFGAVDGIAPPLEGSEQYVPGFLSTDKFCKVVTCDSENPTEAWTFPEDIVTDGVLSGNFALLSREDQQAAICRVVDQFECDDDLSEEGSCAFGCCDAQTGLCAQTPVDRLCTEDGETCGCELPAFFWRECFGDDCSTAVTSVFAAGANAFYVSDAAPQNWQNGDEFVVEMNDEVSEIASGLLQSVKDLPVTAFFRDDFGNAYLLVAINSSFVPETNSSFIPAEHALQANVYMPSAKMSEVAPDLDAKCGGTGVTCSGTISSTDGIQIEFAERCDGCGAYIGPLPLAALANGNSDPADAITFKIGFQLKTLEENESVERPHGGRRLGNDEGSPIDVWNIFSNIPDEEGENKASEPWQFRLGEVIRFEPRCVHFACLSDGVAPRLQFKTSDFQLAPPTVRAGFKTRSKSFTPPSKVKGISASAVLADEILRTDRGASVYTTDPAIARTTQTENILLVVLGFVAVAILIIIVGIVVRNCAKEATSFQSKTF
jgi:hypothetical protein